MVEADFQRYYGIDLREWDDTPRRLWALVQGLPPEAATFRDRPESWTVRDEMAAALVEIIDSYGRQWLMAQGVKESQLPRPAQIPRPVHPRVVAAQHDDAKKRVVTDSEEIKRWFETA